MGLQESVPYEEVDRLNLNESGIQLSFVPRNR